MNLHRMLLDRAAADSLRLGGLLGLAHKVRVRNAVKGSEPVRWQDVDIDETNEAVQLRREPEVSRF